MTKLDSVQKNLLEKLKWLCPDVQKLPMDAWGDKETIYWVNAEDVCYLTTRFEQGDYRVMAVTATGKQYYSMLRIGDFEEKLKGNPWFMRTSRSLMVNFRKIIRSRYSAARDLWFEGIEEPQINAVSSSNLKEFKERFEDF